MSGEDEECPGQPVWHSVLLFCCKGMIEGIIVLLFIWLLVQVLFTKHLEVHLQILLGVGLAVFCFSLILGCFLCCRHMKQQSPEDKEAASSQAPPTAADDHVTHAQSPTPSSGMTSVRVQYEELEGEVLEYPSAVGSSSSSDDDFVTSRRRSRAASELNEQYKSSFFPLRRLSSPSLSSSLYRPMTRGRSSLPSLPKLSLLSKTRKVLEHYCTVTGDSFLYSERCRLTSQSPGSPGTPSALQSQCLLLEEASLPNYGSNSLCELTAPSLNFSLIFSPARQSLTISLLSLTGTLQRLVGVSVLAQLPPVRPDAVEMSARHCSLGPQLQGHSLVLDVGCLEELQSCVLRLTVFSLNALGHRASSLGELEIPCRDMVWEPELPITCTRELRQPVDYVENSVFCEGVEALGKILIQLQYQALIHRLKVTVVRVEHLSKLPPLPGLPEHCVLINLRNDGLVIGSRETTAMTGCDTVWNASFLFDLPPGDISQLSITLEFTIMQGHLLSTSRVLGHVLIGQEYPGDGQTHWRTMCSRGQDETAQWHTIQPGPVTTTQNQACP